jgi:hypothetical protein
MGSAKEVLVSTLTNSLAVTRVGRLDVIRKEAERLVDEALKEHSNDLAGLVYDHPEFEVGGYGDGLLDAYLTIKDKGLANGA